MTAQSPVPEDRRSAGSPAPHRPAASLVQTDSLSKHYGSTAALEDCSLTVSSGEVFGLLGPNGAGKTTLLRLLLGFLRPTGGSARIGGLDVVRQSVEVRRLVAYLPGEVRLFRQMRGREVLGFFADARPGSDRRDALELAERLELDVSRRVAFMSTGMRQKLALAAAFATRVPLLILDEPTSNLDPSMRAVVTQMVHEAKQRGRTVLFSSHVLSEVEEVCDRVAILRAGRLVHLQVMAELRKRHRIHAVLNAPLSALPEEFTTQVSVADNTDEHLVLDTLDELRPLLGWLATLPVDQMRIEPVGLRVVYDQFHPSEPGPAGRDQG